jgi:hypothetical protein
MRLAAALTDDRLRDLSVITVADLPWPHNP